MITSYGALNIDNILCRMDTVSYYASSLLFYDTITLGSAGLFFFCECVLV